jgi:thiosulfate/3-mercaptopyruvate sulfurtransferase
MTRSLWRISLILFFGVVLLTFTSCQLIQAPQELAEARSADVLRGPYEWQEIVVAAPVEGELYGWEKVAAEAHAAKLAGAPPIVEEPVLAMTADVLRAPYEWQDIIVASPAVDTLSELYGWEKIAAEAYATKLSSSPTIAQEPVLVSTADILRAPYDRWSIVESPGLLATANTPDELAGYVNPHALVTTDWLAAHLDDPGVRVLDVRRPTGAANFAVAHIPNAQHVDLMVDLMDRNPNRVALDLIGAERFAGLMGRLGIANDSAVIVYDAEGGTAAATMWWALRYYGHDDVRMLNGGLMKWLIERRDTTNAVIAFEPTEFTVNVQPSLLATAQDIMLAIDNPTTFLIDARPIEYYVGDSCLSAAPRAGHIPGALALPARQQVTPRLKTMLPAEQLAVTLEMMGVSPAQRGITYCGNGHLAAFDAFLLYLMGYEDVAVYDSSWLEWGAMSEMPVETGHPGYESM